MRRLSSLAWRSLGAQKLRSFLTTVGIGLGVAVLYASLSAGAAMDSAVDRAAADEIGHADLRIQALEESGLSSATIDVVRHMTDVAVAAPALERKTYLATSLTQTPSAKLPPPVTVLGIDAVQEPLLHELALSSGRLLSKDDAGSALITQTLAAGEGLAVGGTLTVNGAAASGPPPRRSRS